MPPAIEVSGLGKRFGSVLAVEGYAVVFVAAGLVMVRRRDVSA